MSAPKSIRHGNFPVVLNFGGPFQGITDPPGSRQILGVVLFDFLVEGKRRWKLCLG
jgi:hypothetical protein